MNTGTPSGSDLVKAYYTPDATVMPPATPAINDPVVLAKMFAVPGGVAKNFKFSNVVIDGHGDLAYSRGNWEGAFPPPGGGTGHDKGKFLETWKKQAGGSWKALHSAWNSDMPAGFAMPTGAMKADAPAEVKAMDAFVGTWKLDAEMKSSPLGPAATGTVVMDCRWLMNGLTVMCRNEGMMGSNLYQEVYLMSYDTEAKAYSAYDVDNAGVMAPVEVSYKDKALTLTWDLKMGGEPLKIRAAYEFPNKDAWTMTQEFSTGGAWAGLQVAKATRMGQ